jgi:ankyrin repeat protein
MKPCPYYLNENANINAKDNAGWTALILAAQNGHSKTVTKLLDQGADINITDQSMTIPL